METTVSAWWFCPECGVEAEMAPLDGFGAQVPCPDCPGSMVEHWCWSSAA